MDMEDLKTLVRGVERFFHGKMQSAVSSTLRFLSDTSRTHVMIIQGEDVFEALCTLEKQDTSSIRGGIRIREDHAHKVPVRTRVFGEYSLTLTVIEWPLHPSERATIALLATIQAVLAEIISDRRQIDGITLVANELVVSTEPDFLSCFVEAHRALIDLGYNPLAVLQHCDNLCKAIALPFDTLHFSGSFFTEKSLHRLLSKKLDPAQR